MFSISEGITGQGGLLSETPFHSHPVTLSQKMTTRLFVADEHPLASSAVPAVTGLPCSALPGLLSDLDGYGVIDLDGKVPQDEEKTVFGNAPGSRSSTRRFGWIVKRMLFLM
jgi:hypothetical protein